MSAPPMTVPKRPDSAVSPVVGLAGLVGFALAVWFLLGPGRGLPTLHQTLVVFAAMTLPMVAMDVLVFRVHRRALTASPARRDWRRVAIKLLGLYGVFAAIGIGYWLFPEYHDDFYRPYFRVLKYVAAPLALLAVPYFLWMDRRMPEPCDGAWHAGMALLGRHAEVDKWQIGQFLRTWLVKAFFLPIMFCFTVGSVGFVLHGLETGALYDGRRLYGLLYRGVFLVDLGFATLGYAMTLRILDSHVRSAEPTLMGWIVAVMCYKPFWAVLVYSHFLQYDGDDLAWGDWLYTLGLFHWLWAAVILALSTFYVWAEMSFGLRFSNLTHRGILTAGPYRFTKHPAYIAKNISWWLIAVPFVTTGSVFDMLRYCLLLLGVNIVYYLRARTEERHLAHDPVYVEYAGWMSQHGMLRRLGEWFPSLFAFRWRDPREAGAALGMRTTGG